MKNKLLVSILVLISFGLSGCGTTAPITPASKQNTTSSANNESDIVAYDGVILALGDSLTEGYQLPAEQAYPAQLKNMLQSKGYNYDVINSGVSGETSTGTAERIDWILSQIDADIVILTIGANDAMRGIDLDITRSNISQIIQTIQAQNIPIILGGMEIYQNLGSDYVTQFASLYPALAKEYQTALIPFFLQGVAADPTLNLADQIHPNQAGYGVIVERNILPVLEPMLVGAEK